MRLGNVLLKVVYETVNPPVAGIFRHRLRNKLRLPALAVRRDDHPAGNLIGDDAAKALADDIQTAVERGGGTCRGDHIAVVHVERVDVQSNVRKQRLKLVFKLPVGGGPFAAEYAGIAQHKRSQTQPNNFRPVVSGLNRAVEQRLRRALQYVLPVGYNHNFSRCDRGKILRRMQGKPSFEVRNPGFQRRS